MIIPFRILGLRRNINSFIVEIKGISIFLWIISSASLYANFKHEVVKGDTLYSISLKYRVPIKELKRVNNLSSENIKLGHVLIIPSSFDMNKNVAEKKKSKKHSVRRNVNLKTHVVKSDDTIDDISKRYKINKKELMAWNNLDSRNLQVGSKLILDEPDFLKPYIVKKGDSLSELAVYFDISIKDIIRLNSLEDQNLIIGQKLYIKKASGDINFHYVKRGDTLGKISYIYGVTAKHLVRLNGERAINLKADSILDVSKIVEENLGSFKISKSKIDKRSNDKFISHRVSVGETLYSIARKYGVLLEELKSWNNLSGNNIFHNQELKIYDKRVDSNVASTDLKEPLKPNSSKSKVRAIANIHSAKSKKLDLDFSSVVRKRDTFDISALVVLDPKIPIFEVNGDFYYWYKPKKISQPSEFYSEDWHSPLNSYKKASQLFKSFENLVKSRSVKNNKLKNKLIIIDPGHGGLDPGAIVKSRDGLGNEIFVVEDEYVYDIALRLYVYLKEYGANIEMTILAPDHLIRDSVSANNTFVNVKNEVYNDYDLNKNDTVDSWISGTQEGLRKRLSVVRKFINKYKNIKDKDILYISLHADNSIGAPRSMGFYYQYDEKSSDSHSKAIIEKVTKGLKRSFYIKGQNLYVLKNNAVKTKFLVEVRNLAFDEEAWAIRSSKLRDQDSRILADVILKILSQD
ncbi:N-acetylmuramoyl-L-alanine amidase [Candidatus Borreliella tachyglossi]|uniref:N-acetylmuramoyl-L-alanine amidase n=1 Tax=Candidatus Borreliella tachyglossi TaxID=1964448 RepID=A0A2S1LXH7_9SPIR|nr:LysM peptidoglycan-binding domain-containing protein [Candidatus Borreliella tachyglossi]AWG42982.1 N-acetylmuramoyl-L-alanine amidase [Candidatus Borreliella tachyglossi]